MSTALVFGYTHISWPGFKKCPCNDPGNYAMMETRDDKDFLVCWCGRDSEVTGYDSPQERLDFIAAHKERNES